MARDLKIDDGAHAVREWRWRSYLDHLEDLGYDLDHGRPAEREAPVPQRDDGPSTATGRQPARAG
jgi:hypothetical protein